MSFSFGQTGGSGGSTPNKPLFGGTSSGGTPSLFGGATNSANTGSSTPSSSSIFGGGSNTGGSALFGNTSNTPAANKPAGNLFGATQTTSGASQPASSPFSFAGATAGGAAKPSLFGGAGGSSATGTPLGGTAATSAPTFSFGNTTASSTPAATPAANKTFSLPSTTPAGPPPGTSLFGGQSAQSGAGASGGNSLFSGGAAKPATTSTSTTPSLFGSTNPASAAAKPLASTPGGTGLFSFSKKDEAANANKNTPAQPVAPTGFFGGAPQSGMQGAQATPKPSLFGGLGSTTPSSTPASKPPTFSLGTTPAPAQPASLQPSATPANTLSLGGDHKSTPASTGAPPSNMFANLGSGTSGGGSSGLFNMSKPTGTTPSAAAATPGAPTTTTGIGSTTTLSTGPSLLSNIGGGASAASSAPASTGTAAPSLFGLGGAKSAGSTTQPSLSTATTVPAATGTTTATPGDAAKTNLAGSTAGPAPSAQSRLKNKSMDEIITRWAADLSKYQREFQQQAETVAKWDRALVENSDKVKQLYAKTFQAERDAAEVERQLTMMEENQQELDSYLDRYEKEIENMMKIHGVGGRSDGLRGPDQERERTYKLAEKLQDRLNELNKDLTEMIEEINSTSQTLSKTGKPDDPLTKVVRVLNSQLSQLQLIDSGAAQLQEKIDKAQKESQRVGANGWNGLGTDATEDFYRSYRGGRTDRFGGVL